MFLIVCYYWTQNFPVTMILGMISKVIKVGDVGDAASTEKTFKESASYIEKLKKFYDGAKFSDISFIRKFQYPFRNPLRIILSLLYSGALMAFMYSAVFALSGLRSPAPDWPFHFYIAEAIFVLIVNCYVMTIAFVWLLIIFVAILWCILSACASSNRQSTRSAY